MFTSTGFNGYLRKYQPVVNSSGIVEIKMAVVYEMDGDVQNFMNSVDDIVVSTHGVEKFKQYFVPFIMFDEIKFKSELGINAKMEIERSDAFGEFDVRLDEVKVARRFKEGVETCVYTMQFTKVISEGNDDISIAGAYLNAKRPDSEGKERKVTFNFKLAAITRDDIG